MVRSFLIATIVEYWKVELASAIKIYCTFFKSAFFFKLKAFINFRTNCINFITFHLLQFEFLVIGNISDICLY